MIKIFKAYKLFSVTAFSLTGLAHDYNIQLKTTRWGSILRVWQDTKYEEADTMPTVPASTLIEKKTHPECNNISLAMRSKINHSEIPIIYYDI